jgi:flagellar basal-body rod modification protein FlgD
MSITNIASEVGASQNDSPGKIKENNLSQDSFMTLLLAQLKMQSPESPFDSAAMMQQISQLTNLASTKGLEQSMGKLTDNLGASQVLQASSLIGKGVQIPSDISALVDSKGLAGSVIVPEGVEKVAVTISDERNNIVKNLAMDTAGKGAIDFNWDGMDENNTKCQPGLYKLSASTIINGEQQGLPTAGTFNVSSVSSNNNWKGVVLNLAGFGDVEMEDIIKIT